MDIDKNIITDETLPNSNNVSYTLNPMNITFKTDPTKKNFINYSNSNLSKKINDLSKTMNQTNINSFNFNNNNNNNINNSISNNINNININNNNDRNLNKNLNTIYPTSLVSYSDIKLTENNSTCPTEDSLIVDSNLDSNTLTLTNLDTSNSISSTNTTSFTTTANPIPIPVNSSSYHIDNRNIPNYSYINSIETPTTLSIENINKTINSNDNLNSLPLFYHSDTDFNNSLNSNNLSIINNTLQQHHQQQQPQQHQSAIQFQPPSFMTATTANPLVSHDQAKKVSFSSHTTSNFNNNDNSSSTLIDIRNNNDHSTSTSTSISIKQEPNINIPMNIKIEESTSSLTNSLDVNNSAMNIDMNLDLELDYSNQINELSKLSSSIPVPSPPPPSHTDLNNSLDLNVALSNQISNLHINSFMDVNGHDISSSTSTNTNIPTTTVTTNNAFSNLQSSSLNERNSFLLSSSTLSSSANAITTTTTNANSMDNVYYSSSLNNGNVIHKPNNTIIYRKNYSKTLKKPQQQQFNYSSKFPLSNSLKLTKKEPGTKINFVKKKVTLKPTLSSSLDTKLSNIDINDVNKKYNSNILHTPHHPPSTIDSEGNLVSPSLVITSPDHISQSLDDYDLSQIQQVSVPVPTPNNSYSGNSYFVRSSTLAIPNRKIRNYGYDSQPLSSSLTTKTIQNQHILNTNSLSEDLFVGSSNSLPYKYNPSTAFHKGYFSLSSQLDILNEKRKKRKESHNATERRRRDFINEKIYELSTLIPESFFEQCVGENKMHKGVILQKSVDYINHLLTSLKTQQDYTSKLEKEINDHNKVNKE
ncbi:hypothetical protein BCR32DRAFT_293348 [Anaeromyces robustus]|uniref:BHLH domain-containing protein n=1 Tax=Anaeromyces robustus TaxID=1754192 RepID=A0A1Y1X627_9FUNG|nr:hypothetical protein BCR32DRAFT_293348 [Anaeromyces robustus]|eukprot:ORX81270.1 hypothetical protein BCR32DRAFT_293348 [Anaeromyces robustus]